MLCYSVFCNDKQIRVFTDVIGALIALEKAKDFAMQSHKAGYPCTIEEFSFSAIIGILVFDTLKQ